MTTPRKSNVTSLALARPLSAALLVALGALPSAAPAEPGQMGISAFGTSSTAGETRRGLRVSPTTPAAPASTAAAFGFTDGTVMANGVRLHYVAVGKGEPVLLLPGWPESWYAWRSVMPRLAASGRAVYALDPRGFGDSEKPARGYDLATASADVHAFIDAVGLARGGGIDIVSHDVGTWIAYAHASAHPADVRRLVLSEALIPWSTGPVPTPTDAQNVKSWHFGFNRLSDLPELLVHGHERAYLTWLFANKSVRGWTIDAASLDEYVRVFSAPGAARAGFDYYREAFNASGMAQMKARLTRKLRMPILTLGGEGSLGTHMLANVQPLAENVRGAVITGCGHYLPEECPNEFARALAEFWHEPPASRGPRRVLDGPRRHGSAKPATAGRASSDRDIAEGGVCHGHRLWVTCTFSASGGSAREGLRERRSGWAPARGCP